jgi:6-phosphofructokinase
MSAVRTVGALTGGGDAPGPNAVIHAVVRACTIGRGVTVFGISEGLTGLVEMKVPEVGLADVAGLLVREARAIGVVFGDVDPEGVEDSEG